MLKKLSGWITRFSTGWVVLSALALMAMFMVFVLPGQAESALQATGSAQSPDTSLGGSPSLLYQIAEDYGEAGRLAYIRARWTFDLVFPLVYTTFLATGISWFSSLLPGGQQRWKLGNLLPILGGLFDYLENGAASLLMGIYPARLAGLAELTIAANLLKWLLISLSFLAYFVLALGAGISRIRKKPLA